MQHGKAYGLPLSLRLKDSPLSHHRTSQTNRKLNGESWVSVTRKGVNKLVVIIQNGLIPNNHFVITKIRIPLFLEGRNIMPPLAEVDVVVGQCCHCDKEIYEDQSVIYDKEGGVSFCDDNCLAEFIRKHPREFVEVLFNFDLIERTKASK